MKLKLTPGALPPGLSFWHPASLLGTWFGAGLMPLAAGTWGSLAALPFAWVIHGLWGIPGLVVATLVLAAAGIWAADTIVARSAIRDPGLIVIDEVAGMFLTLAFAPRTAWAYALAFVLFRLADIVKPFPANWCDAQLHGGLGVMLDDLVAGLYAGIAVWLTATYGMVHYGDLFPR